MSRAIRSAPTMVLLSTIVLLAVGVMSGVLLTQEPAPTAAQAAAPLTTFPATDVVFDDARMIKAIPLTESGAVLVIPDAGTLTASACQPGQALHSGTSPVTIDDRPLLALATTQPLWRDLEPGTRGEDVRALQIELTRIGRPVEVSGTFDKETREAVSALQKDNGGTRPGATLARSSILWLPAPEVVVAECHLTVSATVVPGAEFATTVSQLTGLRLEPPSTVLSGQRIVTFAGITGQVSEGAGASLPVVTDPDILAAVESSTEYALLQAHVVDGASLTVDYRLAEPLQLLSVPPAAILPRDGIQGCIVVGGQATRIDILASRLGQSLVLTPDGTPRVTTVDRPMPDLTC